MDERELLENEFEQNLLRLLKEHPELYATPSSIIFPTQVNIFANASEVLEKSSAIRKMCGWGQLNRQLYLKKLEGMVDRLYQVVKERDRSAERSEFSCLPNSISLFDMGKYHLLSPLDDQTHPLYKSTTDELIRKMLSSEVLTLVPQELRNEELLRHWLKLTAAYDQYVLNPDQSTTAIQRGARGYVMEADNVFDTFLEVLSPDPTKNFFKTLE